MKRVLSGMLVLSVMACGPRLGIRREVPPRANLSDARLVSVANGHDESVLDVAIDPFGAVARTVLTPQAVDRLERTLATGGKFQVIPGCGPVCPQADTRIDVSVTEAKVDPGNAEKKTSKQGSVTLQVRVVRRGGLTLYSNSYWQSHSGGVPGTKEEVPDVNLLAYCIDGAVDSFVADLYPRWVDESFRLEDEGPLEPIVKLAAAGDLDGAEALVRKVLETQPENAKAIYDLGVVFTARGQLEQARDAFKAAAERDPKYKFYLRAADQRIIDRGVLQSEAH